MSEEEALDPELRELRARRLAELVQRQNAAPAPSAGPSTAATPVELSTSSYREFLTSSPRAVIDVWAPWCGPCRTMAPVLEALARELAPHVRFGKLNADLEPALAGAWNVRAIPTLLLFDSGRLVDRVVGAVPSDRLRERLFRVFRLAPGSTAGAPTS